MPELGQWWRDAVVYQVYPRSFADGNGDGLGDLAGLRARLPYLGRDGCRVPLPWSGDEPRTGSAPYRTSGCPSPATGAP